MHQIDTFPHMRRMPQFSSSPLQQRQSRKTAGVMWRRGKYSLTPSVFSSIVEWAGELPTVDVFGTAQSRQKSVRKCWGSRPFDRSWGDQFVYVHPPFGNDAFLWGAWPRDAAVTRTSKQAGKALRSQGHHYARVM